MNDLITKELRERLGKFYAEMEIASIQEETEDYNRLSKKAEDKVIEHILSLIKEGQIDRLKSLNVCRQLAMDEGDGDVVSGDIIADLISELQDNEAKE